jgi:hypothetical protein
MSVLFLSVICSSANAQATRTWVSGVGDDVNPCSRTAPCKTFAGAISKTAAGGEINALDPGGYGAVTITKSITIDGGGTMASILAAGTNGVMINANATSDKVILRNLSINGANTGLNGIKYIAAASLIVQNCHITRFQNSLIDANLTASANLTIDGLTGGFANTAPADAGIRLNTSSGTIRASISNSLLHNLLIGIHVQDNVIATIKKTTMQGNGAASTGVRVGTVAASGSSATHLEGVTISNMNDGVRVTTAGGAVQVSLSNCNILNSLVAASNAGPGVTVTSFANNRFANNAADTKGPFTTKAQQ